MTPPSVGPGRTLRLADRLAAASRQRFVGRQAELALFRSALLASEPLFGLLHLYGPGGIGKTALLAEYAHDWRVDPPAGLDRAQGAAGDHGPGCIGASAV